VTKQSRLEIPCFFFTECATPRVVEVDGKEVCNSKWYNYSWSALGARRAQRYISFIRKVATLDIDRKILKVTWGG
jgi:hypothetical protein